MIAPSALARRGMGHRTGAVRTSENTSSRSFVNKGKKEGRSHYGLALLVMLANL